MKEENRIFEELGFEECVLCHNPINILIETPIRLREGYVEGAGQTCKSCYNIVYNLGGN